MPPQKMSKTISLRGVAAAVQSTPMLVIIWTVTFIYMGALVPVLQQRVTRWDFSIYYASALALREGANPYRDDLKPFSDQVGVNTVEIHRAAHPPTFLLCFEPLTLLNPKAAYWIWFLINLAALVGILLMLLGPRSGLGIRAALALVAFALLYGPLCMHFLYAQSQLIVLLMILLGTNWLRAGRN